MTGHAHDYNQAMLGKLIEQARAENIWVQNVHSKSIYPPDALEALNQSGRPPGPPENWRLYDPET